MNMKKILRIAVKIVVGIFVFYLFVGFIILPLAVSWGIKSQGTKLLKHPVSVKWVQFNPILLNLTVRGLEIRDAQKNLMAGFDKFHVDVSFISLFKKIYRVESLELDGLDIQAALLPDGKINLMDLVPQGVAPKTAEHPQNAAPVKDQNSAPAAMPVVVIDAIHVRKGSVHFTDYSVNPNFKTSLNNIDIHITGLSTKPDSQAKVVFEAKLDDKGTITTEVLIKPFAQPLNLEIAFSMDGYALDILTPYTGKYTGRSLKDGSLTLKMDYRIADNKLTASHKVLVQRFEFGQKVESKDALHLPFGLVVGLL